MTCARRLLFGTLVFSVAMIVGFVARAADDADNELIQTIVGLVKDNDADLRAVGLQQIREAVKGEKATKQFADLLPKLAAEGQVGLIDALAARGDKAARPAVADMLGSKNDAVQAAALRALGSLGDLTDVPVLVKALADANKIKGTAARASLARMPGNEPNTPLAAELKAAKPALRIQVLEILVERDAGNVAPVILPLASDADAEVRAAAVGALAKLAKPDLVADLVAVFLKTTDAAEREALEKAIMFACSRAEDAAKRAEPLLAAMDRATAAEKLALLPALGRVGGLSARKVVDAALAAGDAAQREAGFRALCNWPDASVAERLTELAQKGDDPKQRIAALRALLRVSVLADGRDDAARLDLLKKAAALATRDDERKLAIDRAKAIRTIESLHFVLPYLDNPKLAPQACATVVELAHHKGLREPNKPAFDKALDRVIALCKDPVLVDRAQRYKAGKTIEK